MSDFPKLSLPEEIDLDSLHPRGVDDEAMEPLDPDDGEILSHSNDERRRERDSTQFHTTFDWKVASAIAEAEAAVARVDQAVDWLPEALKLGLIKRVAMREAAGWLGYWKIPIAANRLAVEAIDGGSGWSVAKFIGVDDQVALGRISEALGLARLIVRIATYRRWDPLSDITAAELLASVVGASSRHAFEALEQGKATSGDEAASRKLLSTENFERWKKVWFPPRDQVDLWRIGQAAAAWMDAGCTLEPSLIEALAFAAVGARRRLKACPLPFWSACAQRRELLPVRDADAWPTLFLQLTAESAKSFLWEADRLREWWRRAERAISERHADSIECKVLRLLAAEPVVGASGLSKKLNCAMQSANRALANLEKDGLTREISGRASFRVFEMS